MRLHLAQLFFFAPPGTTQLALETANTESVVAFRSIWVIRAKQTSDAGGGESGWLGQHTTVGQRIGVAGSRVALLAMGKPWVWLKLNLSEHTECDWSRRLASSGTAITEEIGRPHRLDMFRMRNCLVVELEAMVDKSSTVDS